MESVERDTHESSTKKRKSVSSASTKNKLKKLKARERLKRKKSGVDEESHEPTPAESVEHDTVDSAPEDKRVNGIHSSDSSAELKKKKKKKKSKKKTKIPSGATESESRSSEAKSPAATDASKTVNSTHKENGVWEWLSGAKWERYDPDTQKELETAWQKAPSGRVPLTRGYFAAHPKDYHVHLSADGYDMYQVNMTTGFERDVRRVLLSDLEEQDARPVSHAMEDSVYVVVELKALLASKAGVNESNEAERCMVCMEEFPMPSREEQKAHPALLSTPMPTRSDPEAQEGVTDAHKGLGSAVLQRSRSSPRKSTQTKTLESLQKAKSAPTFGTTSESKSDKRTQRGKRSASDETPRVSKASVDSAGPAEGIDGGDSPGPPIKLKDCPALHMFHRSCIEPWLQAKKQCPVCKTSYGTLTGNQPPGKMKVRVYKEPLLEGFDDCGAIEVSFSFHGGIQGPEHQNPGLPYPGTTRTGYLPDNEEGRKILAKFKTAWERKLMFTIGTSITRGVDNLIVWNGIHVKTETCGGAASYGYPDETYFARVSDELAQKGIL